MSIANVQKKYFEEYYRKNSSTSDIVLKNKIIKLVNKKLKSKHIVLDIGAGCGDILSTLNICKKKIGVDLSKRAVSEINKKGYLGVVVDVSKKGLPFKTNSVDIIICTEVLEHIYNPEFLLSEVYRVLRVGGMFYASVPNIYQLATIPLFLLDIPPINCARYRSIHYRDFTKRLFKKALKENNFDVKKIKGDIIFPFKSYLSQIIASTFPRFANILIAECKKTL